MSGMLQKSDISCALLFAIFIFNAGNKDDTPLLVSVGGATNKDHVETEQDDDNGITCELLAAVWLSEFSVISHFQCKLSLTMPVARRKEMSMRVSHQWLLVFFCPV